MVPPPLSSPPSITSVPEPWRHTCVSNPASRTFFSAYWISKSRKRPMLAPISHVTLRFSTEDSFVSQRLDMVLIPYAWKQLQHYFKMGLMIFIPQYGERPSKSSRNPYCPSPICFDFQIHATYISSQPRISLRLYCICADNCSWRRSRHKAFCSSVAQWDVYSLWGYNQVLPRSAFIVNLW
jgi:hypothetical protein